MIAAITPSQKVTVNRPSVVMFRPSDDQVVLVVASNEPERTEAQLRPQLGARLCIVPSRWSRQQLDAVRSDLHDQWREWRLDLMFGHHDDRAQASVRVELMWITAELADWADSLPDGLLTLVPSLAPASAVTPG